MSTTKPAKNNLMHPEISVSEHMAVTSIFLISTYLLVIFNRDAGSSKDNQKIHDLDNEGTEVSRLKCAPLVMI